MKTMDGILNGGRDRGMIRKSDQSLNVARTYRTCPFNNKDNPISVPALFEPEVRQYSGPQRYPTTATALTETNL